MIDVIARGTFAIGSSIELSILLKSTVFLGLTIIALAFTRQAKAATRHLLLASTFGTLLILPILATVLPPFSLELATADTPRVALSPVTVSSGRLVERVGLGADRSNLPGRDWTLLSATTLVRMVWAIGTIVFLAPVAGNLWRLRTLRRCGLPWPDKEGVAREVSREIGMHGTVEILLHQDLRSPATCGFTRPAVLFPTDAHEWNATSVRQAMVHELEHVRRGDWAILLLARIVCALYWFHPLVWTAWCQLSLEAEHACDDAVLQSAERSQYAEQLVGLARRLAAGDAHRPLLSMASRDDLSARVSAVLDTGRSRGHVGPVPGAVIVAMAVVVVVSISPLRAVPASGPQSPTSPKPMAFEAASVKSNKGGGPTMSGSQPGGRVAMINVPLRMLIRNAYQLQDEQIVDAPNWITAEHFDIIAKASADIPPPMAGNPGPLQFMMQSLLSERFKLVVHRETREFRAYALELARRDGTLGPQLRSSTTDCGAIAAARGRNGGPPPVSASERPQCGMRAAGGQMIAGGFPLSEFAVVLSSMVQRVVINKTGLTGNFDLELKWTPDRTPQGPPSDPDSPSILTALQEQLGLKLESVTNPVEVLVIDHVEHPTED